MLEALGQAIDELSIPINSPSLCEAHRLLDAFTAKVAAADAAFDKAQLWDLEGETSMRGWLYAQTTMTSRDAGWTARIAARLAVLPATLEAWVGGALSHGQVQAIVANVNDRRLRYFQAKEAALLAILGPLDTAKTVKAMREWSEVIDAVDPGPEPPAEPERSLHMSRTLDERGEFRGSFDPVTTAIIEAALTVGERRDYDDGERRTIAMRRADSLADICEFFLNNHDRPSKRRHRPHVNLVISLEELQALQAGETIDGQTVAYPDLATWVCDSTLHRVVMVGSEVLDYGLAVHSAPPPLFQAIATRDRHCRWPGCDRKARYCDAHHIREWWKKGPTRLDNMCLFCRRHHKKLHSGWHAKLLPDGTVEITGPNGRALISHPPRAGPLFELPGRS